MARKPSKVLASVLTFSVVLGLAILTFFLFRKQSPQKRIYQTLTRAGIGSQTAKYWVAVSAHETNGWTSRAYKEGHNLFGMTLASKNTTAKGLMPEPNKEGLAQFESDQSSVDDMVLFQQVRWKYPPNFTSIESLTEYMKSKGYFTDTLENYTAGVKYWYNKLYEDGTN